MRHHRNIPCCIDLATGIERSHPPSLLFQRLFHPCRQHDEQPDHCIQSSQSDSFSAINSSFVFCFPLTEIRFDQPIIFYRFSSGSHMRSCMSARCNGEETTQLSTQCLPVAVSLLQPVECLLLLMRDIGSAAVAVIISIISRLTMSE